MYVRYAKSLASSLILGILPPVVRARLIGLVTRHKTHRAYFPPSATAPRSMRVIGAETPKIGLTSAEYFTLISADGSREFSAALKKIARDRGLPVKRGAHAGYDWYYLGRGNCEV
jgi:hypothetical protein